MSAWGKLAGTAGAAAGLVGLGLLADRRLGQRPPNVLDPSAPALGSLRGRQHEVELSDGTRLYAEVDEPDGGVDDPTMPTIVFVHGFALSLDSWHYQRLGLRPGHRLVLYDHRSHGRSDEAESASCTIEQLGADLGNVLEQLVPEGPMVLVGHSMGGMTIMALASQQPQLFGERVVGVALISTSAGDLSTGSPGLSGLGSKVLYRMGPGALTALARTPKLTESGRKLGADVAYHLTEHWGFGDDPAPELVAFTDSMLSATPIGTVAAFFSDFGMHERYAALATLRAIHTVVICGTDDSVTPLRHARQIAERLPSAHLLTPEGAGHMVMLERPTVVNRALHELVERAQDDVREQASGKRRARRSTTRPGSTSSRPATATRGRTAKSPVERVNGRSARRKRRSG